MLHDLNTYLHKAIPDTKLTIRKYLDVKFEYLVSQQPRVSFSQSVIVPSLVNLFKKSVNRETKWILCVFQSYCLKVKEMDDEEYSSIVSRHLSKQDLQVAQSISHLKQWIMCFLLQAMGEPLYRVSTGNYEYRLVLRCRQEARARFAKMRKDVLEKIELLDQKHGLLLLLFTTHSGANDTVITPLVSFSLSPTKGAKSVTPTTQPCRDVNLVTGRNTSDIWSRMWEMKGWYCVHATHE